MKDPKPTTQKTLFRELSVPIGAGLQEIFEISYLENLYSFQYNWSINQGRLKNLMKSSKPTTKTEKTKYFDSLFNFFSKISFAHLESEM